jgi:hypothetical protein
MREHVRIAGPPGRCPAGSHGDTSRGFPRSTWPGSPAAPSSEAALATPWTGRNSTPRFRQAWLPASSQRLSAPARSVVRIATHNGRSDHDRPPPRVSRPPLGPGAVWRRWESRRMRARGPGIPAGSGVGTRECPRYGPSRWISSSRRAGSHAQLCRESQAKSGASGSSTTLPAASTDRASVAPV